MELDVGHAALLKALPTDSSQSFLMQSPLIPVHTQVMKREEWKHLLIQTHLEPADIAPLERKPPPQTEIILLASGAMRMKLTANGHERRYDNRPGHLFFTPANGDPYLLQWNSVSNDPIRTIHIYLNNNLLGKTAASIAGTDSLQVNLQDKSCVADPLLEQLVHSLGRELEKPEAASEIYAEIAAQMIAVHLLRNHCTIIHRLPESYSKLPSFRLKQINEYIHANMEYSITLGHLASIAFMSPYHFCRVFKRTTGLSPNQYVINQRMKKAVVLFTSGLGVEQVANAVGYRNVGHFTQLYRRHIGYFPAAHRRLLM